MLKTVHMNIRNVPILGIVIGAVVAAAVTVMIFQRTQDSYKYEKVRYVVIFDHAIANDKDATAFKAFLNNASPKSNTDLTLTFAGAKPSPIPDKAPPLDAVATGPPIFLHVPAPGQRRNPNTLHVTQKVAVFQPDGRAELLKTGPILYKA